MVADEWAAKGFIQISLVHPAGNDHVETDSFSLERRHTAA
jgi:hypothetical protein